MDTLESVTRAFSVTRPFPDPKPKWYWQNAQLNLTEFFADLLVPPWSPHQAAHTGPLSFNPKTQIK